MMVETAASVGTVAGAGAGSAGNGGGGGRNEVASPTVRVLSQNVQQTLNRPRIIKAR